MSESGNPFEGFLKAGKSDWEKVAEKELHGKPVDSLNYLYHNNINMPPLLFPAQKGGGINPILWRRILTWQNGLIFRKEISLSEKEIEKLIHLNINYFKCFNSQQNRNNFLALRSQFPDCEWHIQQSDEIEILGSNAKKGYHLNSSHQDAIDQITELMYKGIQLIQHNRDSGNLSWLNSGNLYFSREIHPNYLYEIALGRAQRILWRNVLQVFNLSSVIPPYFISIFPVIKQKDQILIEASTKILSAKLGGADLICLEIEDVQQEIPMKNIAHIFNIMAMESGIGEVTDPVAGSYYLDELTSKIATHIWQQLKS